MTEGERENKKREKEQSKQKSKESFLQLFSRAGEKKESKECAIQQSNESKECAIQQSDEEEFLFSSEDEAAVERNMNFKKKRKKIVLNAAIIMLWS